MIKPTFLIIGAAKAGTTSLWMYLRQHPQIFMPERKESHYFSYANDRPNKQGPGDIVNGAITDWDEYIDQFCDAGNAQAIGEASPTYLYLPHVAARIKERLPNVKLIVILRDPAARAFSAYMHLRRDGREPLGDFGAALAAEPKRIRDDWEPLWHYLQGGFYFEQLQPYLASFDPHQIHIAFYNDFCIDNKKVLQNIHDFLKVNRIEKNVIIQTNMGGMPKNKWLHDLYVKLFVHNNPIKTISRLAIPDKIRWQVTTTLRNRNLQRGELDEEIRQQLIQYYGPDIEKLQIALQRDLSAWLT